MKHSKLFKQMYFGGLLSVVISLPYLFHVFGPTEGDVTGFWGKVSLYLGLVLLVLITLLLRPQHQLFRYFLVLAFVILVIIQIPPIFLWFAFDGHGITDGTPVNGFKASWMYSIPHIVAFIIGIQATISILRSRHFQ